VEKIKIKKRQCLGITAELGGVQAAKKTWDLFPCATT